MSIRRITVMTLLAVSTTACQQQVDGSTKATTTPADPFTLFDPCTDIPADFMDERGLRLDDSVPPVDQTVNGVTWHSCGWIMTDGFDVTVSTTTLTLELVESRGFDEFERFTIGDRQAASYRRLPGLRDRACAVDVELGTGTLDISLGNAPFYEKTGHLDSCDLARSFAADLVELLPR